MVGVFPTIWLMVYKLATVNFVVRECDEAIALFTDKLNFNLLKGTSVGNGNRYGMN